jgi:hypothetical protein
MFVKSRKGIPKLFMRWGTILGGRGLLDEIFECLCSRTPDEGWTSLDELSNILKGGGLGREDTEGIIRFLRSYFLEVDEAGHRARLSSWAHKFFGISEL